MKKKIFISMAVATSVLTLFSVAALGKQSIQEAKASDSLISQGDVVSKDKMRIWIGYDKDNPFYSYATQMKLWIHSASSGGSEKVYTLSSNGGTFYNTSEEGNTTSDSNVDKVDSGTEHSGHRRYDYFDIDTSCFTNSWYLTVQKFEGDAWKGSTNSFQLTTDNANKCFYVWGDWSWDSTKGTISVGGPDTVDAGMAAKALGGLHSCSDSKLNGYNAIPNIESTFIFKSNSEWKTVGNIGDYYVNDYTEGDTSLSGSKTNKIDAYTKYSFMKELYQKNNPSSTKGIIVSTDNNVVIIAVIIAGLVTALGFALYHRRNKLFD